MGSEGILNRLMELSRTAALAEMASGIAHELNQPLGAIATFGEAGDRLLNRPEPLVPRAREVFQHISAEAQERRGGDSPDSTPVRSCGADAHPLPDVRTGRRVGPGIAGNGASGACFPQS